MIVPALIAGVVVGIIGQIPLINCCNICCLWIIAGGALAAYLLSRKDKIELVDGAVVGALSGLVYAVVATIVGFAVGQLISMLGLNLSLLGGDTGSLDYMSQMGANLGVGVLGALIGLCVRLILGVVFGAVGGVVATKALEKRK